MARARVLGRPAMIYVETNTKVSFKDVAGYAIIVPPRILPELIS